MYATRTVLIALVLSVSTALPSRAGEATVAVASNFLETAERLAEIYEAETGHDLTLAHGSSGRLFAQIAHGAPFDLFLSADAERPAQLMADGRARDGRTYAIGRLAVLSRDPAPNLPGDLAGARIAIANADVAPYGAAAEEVLARWGIAPGAATILRGESVGQTVALFATGNADFAIVSTAQADAADAPWSFRVPADWHSAIVQDAVLLTRNGDNPAAMGFLDLLTSADGRALIAADGYDLPPGAGE